MDKDTITASELQAEDKQFIKGGGLHIQPQPITSTTRFNIVEAKERATQFARALPDKE